MHPSRYEQPFVPEADPLSEEQPVRRPAFVDWLSVKWSPVVDFLGATKPLNLIVVACGIIAIISVIAHALS
jgi:hypothetical protein